MQTRVRECEQRRGNANKGEQVRTGGVNAVGEQWQEWEQQQQCSGYNNSGAPRPPLFLLSEYEWLLQQQQYNMYIIRIFSNK